MVEKFGAYEILLDLKTGGMGSVLLGRRRGPGAFEQLVAIKTIRAEFASTAAVRAMFLDEAAILARLNHPGVATVHDFGEEGGTLYMVMEYVAGIPFRDLMELTPPPTVVARAIAEACRGLHAAHEIRNLQGDLMGLVHRDISPDNLMLGYDGHVKVIDFGIALVKNRQAPVTEFGTVKGKPPYMSPEQVKNESMDRRSDVFSLAVVLHELLTGKPLFDGDSIYAIARAVEHQEIKPPSSAAGELPLGLDAAVMNALDRDPAQRTPTAAAFAEQLEQVLQTAGDETLEAWADRELRVSREQHRAWIAKIVSGRDLPTPVAGRPTGMVTAIGNETPQVVVAPADVIDPGASTHLEANTGADELERYRTRSKLPLILGLLVLLLMIGGTFMLLHNKATPVPADAGVDSRIVVIPAKPDAAIDAAQIDAAVPIDAAPIDGGHRTVPKAIDAAVQVVAAPDAAPAVVAGTGFITVGAKGPYAQVSIDGRHPVPTPLVHVKISAGKHKIDLLDAQSGDLLYTETVTIADGASVTVMPK